MLVAIAYAIVGLMVGFVLKKYISDGVEKDLTEANELLISSNSKLRTQVNTLLLSKMPYDCSEGQLVMARAVVKVGKGVDPPSDGQGYMAGDTDGDAVTKIDAIDRGEGASPRFVLAGTDEVDVAEEKPWDPEGNHHVRYYIND